ncbi:MAG: retinal pigment epithelial rane family protein, partial [Solimicrobium sp.]|nr:retinal pigment epithelial rane family protein [Solimicrobium sp.]
CAHPKIDPHTGELITFRSNWEKPWLRYTVINPNGSTSIDLEIEVAAPSMMHDIAITATQSIVLDLNVAYDFSLMARGFRIPLRWHEERQSQLGLIPRHGDKVRWFEIAPCFIQHVVNAYDLDESTIILDVIRYPFYFRLTSEGTAYEDSPTGVLWRYVIDLSKGVVSEKSLSDIGIELPRINETRTGLPYRYLYAVEQPTNTEMRGVIRYDLEKNSIQRYIVAEGDQNSEPVFVPRPGATCEDDGWLLVCVWRCMTDTSDIVILDAQDISRGPVATVRLPRRIPAGFHGAWVPG